MSRSPRAGGPQLIAALARDVSMLFACEAAITFFVMQTAALP